MGAAQTSMGSLLKEPVKSHDPFDPNNWDIWTEDEETQQEARLTAPRRNYAEIDAAVNVAINHLDEDAELHHNWNDISLGGPVEPFMPTMPWNGILIVGKAPGDAELAHGEPFTGRSGRLLDRMLSRLKIDRPACMITNAFRMQAPWSVDADGKKQPNDVSYFFTDDPRAGNDRLPALNGRWVIKGGPDDHIRDLWRLIRDHKPRVVLAMGAIAAWAITGDGTLKDRMGQPLANPCSDAPVVLAYHPAYALHKKDEAIAALIAEHVGIARDIAASL